MKIERPAVSIEPVNIKLRKDAAHLRIMGFRAIEKDLYFSATFYDAKTGLVVGSQIVIGDGDSRNDDSNISIQSLVSDGLIVRGFISNPAANKFALEFHFSQNNIKLDEILRITGSFENSFSNLEQIIKF